MMPVFDDLCLENGLRGSAAMYSNTPPLLGFSLPPGKGLGPNSPRFNAAVVKLALERKVRIVVMVAAWSLYASDEQFGKCLEDTIHQLTAAGIRVVLMRAVPHHKGDVPRLLVRAKTLGQNIHLVGVPIEAHRFQNLQADQWLETLAGPLVSVLDPTPYLSDETGLCRAEFDGVAMYRDSGHLTVEGTRRLKPVFGRLFYDAGLHGPSASDK